MITDTAPIPRSGQEIVDLHLRLQLANKLFEMLHKPYFQEHTRAAINDLYHIQQRQLASHLTKLSA